MSCQPIMRRTRLRLVTDVGVTVKNRHRWVVDEVGADGSLAVIDEDRGQPGDTAWEVRRRRRLSCVHLDGDGRPGSHRRPFARPRGRGRSTRPALRPDAPGRDSNDVRVVTDPSAPSEPVDVLAEVMHRR